MAFSADMFQCEKEEKEPLLAAGGSIRKSRLPGDEPVRGSRRPSGVVLFLQNLTRFSLEDGDQVPGPNIGLILAPLFLA